MENGGHIQNKLSKMGVKEGLKYREFFFSMLYAIQTNQLACNKVGSHLIKRGAIRGMEIRRSVLFFGPNLSICHYFCPNPDPHYVKTYCDIGLLH